MYMNRRHVLSSAVAALSAAMAGCSLGYGGTGGGGGSRPPNRLKSADVRFSFNPGDTWTWTADVEEGNRLSIGARGVAYDSHPIVTVESASGEVIDTDGPGESVFVAIDVESDDEYVVTFENDESNVTGVIDINAELYRE